jgi:hypothetical protein
MGQFVDTLHIVNVTKIYKNSVPFLISRSFDANMTWRNIITHWLSDKFITQEGNLATLDLIILLIEKNMIPATLIDNPTLHSIILTQIILETLTGITVPRAPQGNTFTYHMNAIEMMMWDMARKKRKAGRGIGKRNGGEFGSLSQTEH